jgi:hypothetical protein
MTTDYDRISKMTTAIAAVDKFLAERSGQQKIACDPSELGFTLTLGESYWRPLLQSLRDRFEADYRAELSNASH